jgi:hypothetical protein
MKRLVPFVAIASAVTVVLTGVLTSPASAAVTVNIQHCSTSKSTCVDQTVDNNGEVCIVAKLDTKHHANWCIYSHGWYSAPVGTPYADGRVRTCVGYQACVGVDHFQWVDSHNWSPSQIILWQYGYDKVYYARESGSADIPSGGTTGPTNTLYTTADYNFSANGCSTGVFGIMAHTEVDLKVFWTNGTHTTALDENSDNYCHGQ